MEARARYKTKNWGTYIKFMEDKRKAVACFYSLHHFPRVGIRKKVQKKRKNSQIFGFSLKTFPCFLRFLNFFFSFISFQLFSSEIDHFQSVSFPVFAHGFKMFAGQTNELFFNLKSIMRIGDIQQSLLSFTVKF